jgi:hypothetical protein
MAQPQHKECEANAISRRSRPLQGSLLRAAARHGQSPAQY